MKRGLMEPDPRSGGVGLVAGLWLVVLVMGVIVVLLSLAE